MNSDPYDSAAWRTFGMLDADESAIFDEAMRHDPVLRSAYFEMDRLSAAVGAALVTPVEPRTGQLERLQNRLGLHPIRRVHFWMAVSGWAAAAVLALLLVYTRSGNTTERPVEVAGGDQTIIKTTPNVKVVPPQPSVLSNHGEPTAQQADSNTVDAAKTAALAQAEQDAKANVKVETKRLVQEIEVLRENLEKFHQRDRVLFDAVPGVAVPIVMTMRPPDLDTNGDIILAQNDSDDSITGMLGDALKQIHMNGRTSAANTLLDPPDADGDEMFAGSAVQGGTPDDLAATLVPGAPVTQETATTPSAIPIYDAARDSGTLVVNNLPAAGDGRVYNLWVNTQNSKTPIYVGSLPAASATGADSFDFNLGSTHVLPAGFVLTNDALNKPATPSGSNTVLQGPPASDQ